MGSLIYKGDNYIMGKSFINFYAEPGASFEPYQNDFATVYITTQCPVCNESKDKFIRIKVMNTNPTTFIAEDVCHPALVEAMNKKLPDYLQIKLPS